mgnify:CR=1 FL=1
MNKYIYILLLIIFVFKISRIESSRGSAKNDLFPKARGPNSDAPWNHATTSLRERADESISSNSFSSNLEGNGKPLCLNAEIISSSLY